jgi:hypothetical protein
MPIIDEDFNVSTDAELVKPGMTDTIYALICLAELEQRGWINIGINFNLNALHGNVYRAKRLKLPDPPLQDVQNAVEYTIKRLCHATDADAENINVLVADVYPAILTWLS